MDIHNLTAVELSRALKEGKTTAVEAVETVFKQIDRKEKELNCYITLQKDIALENAKIVQAGIESGRFNGPLAGVMVAVKDNICTKGLKTTCASKILYNYVPKFSSEAVTRLKEAGAIIIGKTNMDEFAMGSTTESSAFGATRNPFDTKYTPGGSSGGSAAAVAAGECFFALGSDTGGSIRQPSSHCGVVGMKPTYGTVSRFGLIAYASSLDQIGPICKDVTDCAAVMEVLAGYDTKDSTSVKRSDTDFMSALINDVNGIRIGIPREYFGEGLDLEVKSLVLEAADVLKSRGAVVEEFDLGLTEYAVPAYYTIASAEASSNLGRFDGVKYGYRAECFDGLHSMYKRTRSEGFGSEVKKRIMLGSFVLSSGYYEQYYLKALKVRRLIKNCFDEAFTKYDIILTPTAPQTAPCIGESLDNPLKMYLSDIYTISANLTGIPAISVPCKKAANGMPVGFQLMADCFEEKKLFRTAYTYECEVGRENYGKTI